MARHTKISQCRHNNLKVCQVKDIQYWIQMTTAATDGTHTKTLASLSRKSDKKEIEQLGLRLKCKNFENPSKSIFCKPCQAW